MTDPTEIRWPHLDDAARAQADALAASIDPLDPSALAGLDPADLPDWPDGESLMAQARLLRGGALRARLEAAIARVGPASPGQRPGLIARLTRFLTGNSVAEVRLTHDAPEDCAPDRLDEVAHRLNDLRADVQARLLDLDRLAGRCAAARQDLAIRHAATQQLLAGLHARRRPDVRPMAADRRTAAAHDLARTQADLEGSMMVLNLHRDQLDQLMAADREVAHRLDQTRRALDALRRHGPDDATASKERLHAELVAALERAR